MPVPDGCRRGGLIMFSVAFVGADGAGKTTITKALLESLPLPAKYLYMGINTDASNMVLPTTRLLERLKQPFTTRKEIANGNRSAKSRGISGHLKSAGRLLINLTEELYRQSLSRHYRRKGFIVLYDRHFQLDFEYDPSERKLHSGCDFLHRWFLAKLYPRPDLVIFLDAPADVLYARKHEATLEWLEWRRQQFLRHGRKVRHFVRIDAAQPLAAVLSEVTEQIVTFHRSWLHDQHNVDAVCASN